MSPQATRRTRKTQTQDKPAVKGNKKATVQQKSKTATLAFKKETERTQHFTANGDSIVRSIYITKDALALLDAGEQKQMDLICEPFDGDRPVNAMRFKEQGEDTAINRGDLYLVRAEAVKLGLTDDTKVRVRLTLAGEGIKLVVSAA